MSGFDLAIVGGLGHVGLPLGLAFAQEGLRVCLLDKDTQKAELVAKGVMPFLENGAEPVLRETLAKQRLHVSTDPALIAKAEYVVLAVGTPVDEYLNPKTRAFLEVARSLRPHLHPAQTIIVRSTVYPGTSRHLLRELGEPTGQWQVAYCPERIVQGHALEELRSLPQIVAGLNEAAEE